MQENYCFLATEYAESKEGSRRGVTFSESVSDRGSVFACCEPILALTWLNAGSITEQRYEGGCGCV